MVSYGVFRIALKLLCCTINEVQSLTKETYFHLPLLGLVPPVSLDGYLGGHYEFFWLQ